LARIPQKGVADHGPGLQGRGRTGHDPEGDRENDGEDNRGATPHVLYLAR
jgi:hypothetical protein